MSQRAAIYTRVSSDEQADNFSLPTQLEAARRYAEAHGLTVAHEFKEDYSGLKLDRPELNKVRHLMAQREIDAVIVYESSRLTRSKAHGPILRDEFADVGVALHFVTRGKHENTLEAELLASTEDTFNWYWWAKMQEAMKRGRKGKAQAGIFVGNGQPPYGYVKVGAKRETRLEVDPDKAEIVRLIYQWYVHDQMSITAITNRLTTRGVPTPTKPDDVRRKEQAGKWKLASVHSILRHEAYAGTFYANRYRRDSEGRQCIRPREEWIPILVPSIIDRATWEQAQARSGQRGNFAREPSYEYLMERRITCACGYKACRRSARVNGHTYLYYGCSREQRTHITCNLGWTNSRHVDAAAWGWVVSLMTDPRALVEGYKAAQQTQMHENADLHEQAEQISRQNEKQQAKLSSLVDELSEAEGAYMKATLRDKCKAVEGTLQALEVEREALMRRLSATVITDVQIQSLEEFAHEVGPEIHNADFAMKRGLIEDLGITGTLALEDGRKVLYLHWYARTERFCINTIASP